MYHVQSWSHELGSHFTVPGGIFEQYQHASEHLGELPTLAGARIVNDAFPPGHESHVHAQHPVFEVCWRPCGKRLYGYPGNYIELARLHSLPLAEYLSDDEPTPIHDIDGEVIGWMTPPAG